MAIRVPTPAFQGPQQLGGLQTQAADTPFQNLQLPDTSFNARMLSQLGESGVQFGRYLREQEDERLLLELQAGIGDWERQLLYGEMPDGTGTATGGILSLEGPDAFGLTERVAQDYDAFLSSMNEQLQGLSVSGRLAAQQFAQSHRETLLDRATRLEFEQREAHNARLRAAALASAQSAAATSWASDEELAAAELRIRTAAENLFTPEAVLRADREGVETEAGAAVSAGFVGAYARGDAETSIAESRANQYVEEAVATEVDTFYRNTIRRALLEGSSASVRRAREIFTQASESGRLQLAEDDLLIRDVTFGEERDARMSIATELYGQFPTDRGRAIQAVRDMRLPGEEEYHLIEEIERRYTQAETLERERTEANYRTLLEQAQEQRMSPTDPLLSGLTAEQVAHLDRINQNLPVVNNIEVLSDLNALLNEGNTAGLAGANLVDLMTQLTPTTYSRWETIILNARSTLADETTPEWRGVLDERATITNAIGSRIGLDTSNREGVSLEERRAVSDLYLMFEQRKAEVEAAGGTWDTQAIYEYADYLVQPIMPPRFDAGNAIPRYQLLLGTADVPAYFRRVGSVPADDATRIVGELGREDQPITEVTIGAVYAGVPASEVGAIISALQRMGIEPTPETIREVYLDGL